MTAVKLVPELTKFVQTLDTSGISEERKKLLNLLLDFIRHRQKSSKAAQLTFICTHNSRRSQLAQVWAQTAAAFFGVDVQCFSGGAEVTAFAPQAVKSLQKTGFCVESSGSENPVYHLYFSEATAPVEAFSKHFEYAGNPQKNFAAVMTCSDADRNCPFIPGTEKRISLPYKDPKEFDGSSQEEKAYDDCSRQIATEMWHIFSNLH